MRKRESVRERETVCEREGESVCVRERESVCVRERGVKQQNFSVMQH